MGKRLPQSVIDAGKRADDLLAAMNEPETEPLEPVVEAAPVQVIQPEPAPVTAQPENKEGYWEHRFKTVEGILNAEKRRASDALRDYEQRVATLNSQVQELNKKVSAVPKQYDLRSYMSPEEIEGLGENLPKIIMRVASGVSKQEAADAVTDVVKRELEPLRERVKQAEAMTQQERVNGFWKSLQRAVPNWQAINSDPKFQTWLSEREGYTKYTRDEVLKSAEQNLDSDTVIEMFSDFVKATIAPPVNPAARKVLPESVAPTNPSVIEEAPLFTGAQVRQHYNDYARGIYKNKSEDWKKLEERINSAIRAGKVSQ